MTTLQHRWALVTGSSRGIGQQIALGLARLGCHLILHGRTLDHTRATQRLLAPFPVQTRVVAGDLGQTAELEALIQAVQAGPAPVDILYNNAAVMGPARPIEAQTPADWLPVFQVNVLALARLCAALVPGMRQRGYGRIINMSSSIAEVPEQAPYSASKAAVDKYTRDLAAELRGTNVLVNTLNPGWLKTDMGGPGAEAEVTAVLPGALLPALLPDFGPSGRGFAALDYTGLTPDTLPLASL